MKTPVQGLSMRRTADGIPVVRIHYSADPALTPERIAQLRRGFSSQAWWDLEMEIKYDALSGQRIYPEFDPSLHVIPDEQIPRFGTRFMAIDPHPRTPHAFLWLLIDRWSDWYIYRELWPSKVSGKSETLKDDIADHEYTVREYAETIADLEGGYLEWKNVQKDDEYALYRMHKRGTCPRCDRPTKESNPLCRRHWEPEKINYRFMDQAGKGFRASGENEAEETYTNRYYRFGIECVDPIKSHVAGEDAIRTLLRNRKHDTRGNWPRLHVAASCTELILEFLKARYQKTRTVTDEKELKQKMVEARVHLLDLTRYLATGNLRYSESLSS